MIRTFPFFAFGIILLHVVAFIIIMAGQVHFLDMEEEKGYSPVDCLSVLSHKPTVLNNLPYDPSIAAGLLPGQEWSLRRCRLY
jgi:hypothetical protein